MTFLELFSSIPPAALILFGLGVLLMIVEMLAPGFGVAGVSSIIAFTLAIVLAADTVVEGLIYAGIVLLVIAVILIVFLTLLSRGKLSSRFILKANNSNAEGFSSAASDLRYLVGHEGSAQTMLRPAGRVLIDGKVYDAASSGDFIPSGKPIRVMEVNGSRITVTALPAAYK